MARTVWDRILDPRLRYFLFDRTVHGRSHTGLGSQDRPDGPRPSVFLKIVTFYAPLVVWDQK